MVGSLIDHFFIKRPHLRRLVTSMLYGRSDQRIRLIGQNLTVNALRENGYLRASQKTKGSCFLEHELNVLLTLAISCSSCDMFVDAGANIGVFSCAMARRRIFDPTFRIMSFEPHPDTYERLTMNTKQWGVETHNTALSNYNGELQFVDGAVSHVFTAAQHISKYNILTERTSIPCRRLDSFDIPHRAIMLKIDVEGHEYQVLEGALRLFEKRSVSAVYIDGYADKRSPAFLQRNGFELFDVDKLLPAAADTFGLLALLKQSTRPTT